MSWLYRTLTAHNSLPHAIRKPFEEVREIIRKLEDIAESLALAQNSAGTNVVNQTVNISGTPSATLSYPMAIFASDQLFPNGFPVDFLHAVRIKRCMIQADPSIPATADTTFSLGNGTSPTSSGSVTIASGATHGIATNLGVVVGVGQRLYIKAPTALNSIQNTYMIRIEWEPA